MDTNQHSNISTDLPEPSILTKHSGAIAGLLALACMGSGAGLIYLANKPKKPTPTSTRDNSAVLAVPAAVPAPPVVPSQPDQRDPPDNIPTSPRSSSVKVLGDVAKALLAKDVPQLNSLAAGQLDPTEQEALRVALDSGRLTVDSNQPVTDIGKTGKIERWGINTIDPATGKTGRLTLDFSTDVTGNVQIESLALPEFLSSETARHLDPLAQADSFLDSLVEQDFEHLRALASAEKVPNEKLAALGIIFDEAKFKPIKKSPLKVTTLSDNTAWVIARVQSDFYDLQSEFGLEMKKVGDRWTVDQVNLSRILKEFVSVSKDEDVPFAPLVEHPQGGESVVLYFGYDNDLLTQKSLRQLGVVASILKLEKKKRIQIGGHADALGEDSYNDQLSMRRARRVADALRALGVRESQIRLQAFGERHPLSPNALPDGSDNPDGRQRNRRTEIFLDF